MTQKYQVKVSMKQAAIVETSIVLKQGDFGMQIEIEVLDFDATGTTPQIVFRKPMGAVESTTITVSSNKYTYTFKGTELDTPGKVFCDLKLKNSTTQRISTASFMFKVVADTLDGLAEESSSYSDTIEQLLQNTLQKSSTAGLVKNDGTINTTIESTVANLNTNAILKSNTAGLVKNDGTINTTIETTVTDLNRDINGRIKYNALNIGDSDSWTVGMYSIDGTFNSGATYARTTDYILIKPYHKMYIYQPDSSLTLRVALFDITKTLIEVLNYPSMKVDLYKEIPEGIYYVRIGTATAGLSNCQLKLEELVDDKKYSNLTINFLGDSLTRGYISATDPKFMNYPMPDQVEKILGVNKCNNYGQSGTCLSNNPGYYNDPMCVRYTNMSDADVVVVMGGTNDMLTGVTIGTINDWDSDESETHTFYGGLNRLMQGLVTKYQTYNNKKKIIFVTFPQNSFVQSHKQDYLDFNNAIRGVAERYSIPVIDLAHELGLSYLYTNTWTVGDGTHFSQKTVTNIFAPYIANKIKQFLG